jgi:CheY-like chemotaxis protein
MAARVVLFHWNGPEAEERAERLRGAGFDAATVCAGGGDALAALRRRPPDAFVIDLARLPSHGREVGMALRSYRDTRRVPIVYVGGEGEKLERIRTLLPDATYVASWRGIGPAVRRAIRTAPADPVKPASVLAGYSGTPLPKKLGIKPRSVVGLSGAPPGFEATLGALPEGATVRRDLRGARDLVLWFVRSASDLARGLPRHRPRAKGGGLWIVWPKKTSGLSADLSESVVRGTAMAAGLVDFKVCAVDDTWSGLRFSLRTP